MKTHSITKEGHESTQRLKTITTIQTSKAWNKWTSKTIGKWLTINNQEPLKWTSPRLQSRMMKGPSGWLNNSIQSPTAWQSMINNLRTTKASTRWTTVPSSTTPTGSPQSMRTQNYWRQTKIRSLISKCCPASTVIRPNTWLN